jgi:membrane associated rhomboid family serine protease
MSYYRQGPFRPGGGGVGIGVPPVTPYLKALMIALGAVWLLQVLSTFVGFHLAGATFERIFGVVPALVIRGMIWQPFTYMFLHDPVGPMHLLFNLLFLWMFGGELERFWGSRAFLRYFLVCGTGGGVFITLMGLVGSALGSVAGMSTPTIGASGALFGLMAAYGMIFGERTVLFMLLFPMKARTMAMILFAVAFFYTFTGSGGNISHVGHLGGAVTGYLYLKRVWRVRDFYRELRWRMRRRKFKVMPQERNDDFDRWVH